jgi:outer membrane protein TolC
MKIPVVLLACALSAFAEVKTMTLRQALEMALAQSPDVMLARLDQQKARNQVTIARDPFRPKIFAGSGAAWTSGFPASVDGAAPSIFQARTQMAIFDRPQNFQVAEANENLRAAEIDVTKQQDEVAYRVASLFLDAEQAARSIAAAQREGENLVRVQELINSRVADGRELPIESKKANLAVLRNKQQVDSVASDLIIAETSLAEALGLAPDDRVRAAQEDRAAITLPSSEEQAIEASLDANQDLRRLESNIQAKTLEVKGYRAQRLPKVNLIAQYELFAKYYYQNYYTNFQRNSGQLGASIDVPLLAGRSAQAYRAQSEADIAKLRIEVDRTRARITADLRRAFQEVKRADSARDVARLDLDVARDQLSLDLAQMDEGRAPLAKVEESRAAENDKWVAYYAAQHAAELARINVLRQMGTLTATLK